MVAPSSTSGISPITGTLGSYVASILPTIVAAIMNGDLTFSPDATYDIGKAGVTRPRDFFYSRTGQGGTLALGGATIGTDALAVTGTATIGGNTFTASAFNLGQSTFSKSAANNVAIWNGSAYTWSSTSVSTGSPDTFLTRPAAATVQLGDASTTTGAVAQTLTFQGNTASTTNGPLALIKGAGGGSGASVAGELRLSGGTTSGAAGTGGAVTIYTAPAGAGATPALVATFGADKSTTLAGALNASGGFSFGGVLSSNSNVVTTYNTSAFAFTNSGSVNGTIDARILRAGAGSFTLDNASTNTATITVGAANLLTLNGQVTAGGPVRTAQYTVGTLPSAAGAGTGALGFVTDATLTAITGLGLAPVGGGTNKVPVYSDGSSWIVV